MVWRVLYHPSALQELAAQPDDIVAHLTRIVALISEHGLERVPAKLTKHIEGPALGVPSQQPRRHRQSVLRHPQWAAHSDRTGVHKEDAKDTTSGDQTGALARRGGHMNKRAIKEARGRTRAIPHEEALAQFRKRPGYQAAYDALEEEFSIMSSLIRARTEAGLTQEQVAARMHSSQSAIARLEAGGRIPSTKTLQRYAHATGHRLRIVLEPIDAKERRARDAR